MGRKSNAVLAAEAAAKVEPVEELAKIEIVDGEKVVTDLEPVAKAPVSDSVDPIGEDLGDVTNQPVETPVIEAGEATGPVDPEAELEAILNHPNLADEITKEIDKEIVAALVASLEDFTPILVPTMVGDLRTGHIPCPKAVFDLVQVEGWQGLIEDQPAHVQAGLKSVLHWKNINGTARVRCQSSSRFADVV